MTEELNAGKGLTEAMIEFKNGSVKYGMLFEEAVSETVRFISGNNYSAFKKNQNPVFIEELNSSEIETIDISLK